MEVLLVPLAMRFVGLHLLDQDRNHSPDIFNLRQ